MLFLSLLRTEAIFPSGPFSDIFSSTSTSTRSPSIPSYIYLLGIKILA
jgi:hypothetical protein